jgi:hypothetical protein
MSRSFVLSELQPILFVGQNRLEIGILGASMRLEAGGRGHRVFEKFGDLSGPPSFVFRELQDV